MNLPLFRRNACFFTNGGICPDILLISGLENLLAMFKKFGPDLLVAVAFVGPGTLTMYTLAGARFGYALISALTLSIVATFILQGMAARVDYNNCVCSER